MKPTLLVLENFQSLRERTEIPISPLTFLYGPNSAGKSCIDDAFSLLSAVFSGDVTANDRSSMFRRWAHHTPAGIQSINPQESITHLELHCQIGRIFEGISESESFADLLQVEDGLLGWFEKSDWHVVLGLEFTRHDIDALTLSSGGETVFRINMSDNGNELEISLKAFGRTFSAMADRHMVEIKKKEKVYRIACEVRLGGSSPVAIGVYKGSDIKRELAAIVNAMLEDIKDLEIAPTNLGADRSTINSSALSKICGTSVFGKHMHSTGLPSNFFLAPNVVMGIAETSAADFMAGLANSSYESAYREVNQPSSIHDSELDLAFEDMVSWNMDIRASGTEELHIFVNRCLLDHLFIEQGYYLVFEALEIKPATDIEAPPLSAALMIGSLGDKTGRRMTFEDVGTGISCVIPVLVAVHSGSSFIQQPELHLHPALQSALGDVFVEATKVENAHHFIETHSEYILLRCLRRVRETTAGKHPTGSPLALKPEDLSVLYFEPQPDGCTRVKKIRVSTQGDFIDRWPRGFFEERGKELFDE